MNKQSKKLSFKFSMRNSLPRYYGTLIMAGGVSAILGLLVIIGWHSHSISLVQIHPSLAPMTYNTALAFLLAGLGFLATTFRLPVFTTLCGALVFSIGLLTLAEYLSGSGLGIDQLFVQDTRPCKDMTFQFMPAQ